LKGLNINITAQSDEGSSQGSPRGGPFDEWAHTMLAQRYSGELYQIIDDEGVT
jgi:hypothetical protein